MTIFYYYSFLFSITNKMSIATSQVFQDSWLEEEEFKSWLRKVKDDRQSIVVLYVTKNFLYLYQEDVL